MPPISMSPGTVLDGRYRLEDLLSEHEGARFWRATDTVLERSVAVHVVASDDPRAPAVLDAARRSAGVVDAHFLRVLDCDDVDGVTWVINEWGEGTSLDIMLQQGTLPPMRAAWLTREVAEAIAAAHAKGLVHGRLNPEAVLVTDSGSVKIIGFVVNAAFEKPAAPSPYGSIGDREADVVDLAGILYAALTGRWPGVAPSGLPSAPREGRRPLRPRQVRAGVPRDLDTLCDRVLHKEAAQHVMPIETAVEIAAALSDFVGDPASVAPVDVPSMHDDPQAPSELEAVAEPVPEAGPVVPAPVAPASPPLVTEELWEPEPFDAAPAEDPAPAPAADPEATMAAAPPFDADEMDFRELDEWEPAAPPPPFEQPVDRPLFADSERRVPAGAPVAPPTGTSWPYEEPEPYVETYVPPRRRRRSGWLILLIVLMAVALAAAMYVAYRNVTDEDDGTPSGDSTTSSTTPSPSTTPSATGTTTGTGSPLTGTKVKVKAIADFDPEGDPPGENPGQAANAVDGDAATVWHTDVYTTAQLGGVKSGVGLVLDLGKERTVSSVEVTLVGTPTALEVWASPSGATAPPSLLSETQQVGRVAADGTDAVITAASPTRSRYVVVWLTGLPKVGAGYQGQIAEITVRS